MRCNIITSRLIQANERDIKKVGFLTNHLVPFTLFFRILQSETIALFTVNSAHLHYNEI